MNPKFRKLRVLAMCAVLSASLLGGCANSTNNTAATDENKPAQEEQVNKDNAQANDENQSKPDDAKDKADNTKDKDKKDESKKTTEVSIYTYNIDEDTLVPNKIKLETVDAKTIFKKLQDYGVIKADAKLNSFEVKDVKGVQTAYIDVDKNFYNTQLGAGAESLMLEAIAKTYQDALKVGQIMLKVDGGNYESGHIVIEDGMFISSNK